MVNPQIRNLLLIASALMLVLFVLGKAGMHSNPDELPPLTLIQVDNHRSCWAFFTDDDCRHEDHYISYEPVSQFGPKMVATLQRQGYVVNYDPNNASYAFKNGKKLFITFGVNELSRLDKVDKRLINCRDDTHCTLIYIER